METMEEGENGVSNWFLNAQLARLQVRDFLGTFSLNDIPVEKITDGSSIIVNLSKAREEGTHFVAIRFSKRSIFFFDSFGLINLVTMEKLLNTLLSDLARQTNRGRLIVELKHTIQDLRSDFCGFYCLYYVLITDSKYRGGQYDLKPFYTQRDRLAENDKIVIQNINSIISEAYRRQQS